MDYNLTVAWIEADDAGAGKIERVLEAMLMALLCVVRAVESNLSFKQRVMWS